MTQPVYRLLQINLRFDNRDARKGAVADRPRAARRDHARTRCPTMWATKLAPARRRLSLPRRLHASATHVGGVAILSRRPFADGAEPRCIRAAPSRRRRSTSAASRVDDRRAAPGLALAVRAVAADRRHCAPTSPARPTPRCWPAISTPRRGALRSRAIAEAGGLRPIGRSADLAVPPAAGVPALCRPADRPGLRQGRRHRPFGRATLEAVGSDHLPVLVEFSLTPPRPHRRRAARRCTAAAVAVLS